MIAPLFRIEDTPDNKYMVKIHFDAYSVRTEGSYNVIAAHLLGIKYSDYLRLCRDEFGATLSGKNSMYVVAKFKQREDCRKLVDFLNIKWRQTQGE